MKGLFRVFFVLFFIGINSNVFAQNEYEEDLDFVSLKTKKKNLSNKINFNFEVGYSMSNIFGQDVEGYKNSINQFRVANNLDILRLEAKFHPYGKLGLLYNVSDLITIDAGVKYGLLGWKIFGEWSDNVYVYKQSVSYKFNYVGVPLALKINPNKNVSVSVGGSLNYLFSNKIRTLFGVFQNNKKIAKEKDVSNFQKVTGIESNKLVPNLFIGTDFGFDQFRISLRSVFVSRFIFKDIKYNAFRVEAGLMIKFFKDYD